MPEEKEIQIDEINYDKLKGKIKEILGTQSKFAEEMESDETTISNKLNNKTYFTQKEIIKACLILHIDFIEIPLYFFTLKVRKNEQNKLRKGGDMEEIEKLKEISKPILEFLKEKYNPHATAIINEDSIKVVIDEISIPINQS